MTSTDLDFVTIDLDEERARRADQRSVTINALPIKFGGEVVAEIPSELPLDVLAPLRKMDGEITLLLRSMMDAFNEGREAQQRWDATDLIVSILTANPSLPTTLVDVAEDMAQRLLSEDGLRRLMEKRPALADVVYMVTKLAEFYGFSLGESRPSSPSSTGEDGDGGTTSVPTLPGTTPDSTSEASGEPPAPPASSEPAAS